MQGINTIGPSRKVGHHCADGARSRTGVSLHISCRIFSFCKSTPHAEVALGRLSVRDPISSQILYFQVTPILQLKSENIVCKCSSHVILVTYTYIPHMYFPLYREARGPRRIFFIRQNNVILRRFANDELSLAESSTRLI